jgi:uncharacterized membrane protein
MSNTIGIILVIIALIGVAVLLSYLPESKKNPNKGVPLKIIIPLVIAFLFGLLLLLEGVWRAETGEPGRFKDGGPVFGWQYSLAGSAIVLSAIIVAVRCWFLGKKPNQSPQRNASATSPSTSKSPVRHG